MTNEALYAYAETQGCRVDFIPLPVLKEVVIHGQCDCIALDTHLSRIEEKEYAAHGIGHSKFGGFYSRSSEYSVREKAERRAEKWAYMKLLPVGEVRSACAQGICEVWQLAELFDVSCEFATKAIRYYQSVGLM